MVEGFGEAKPPQDIYFREVCAGEAGTYLAKRVILGGSTTLQTSRLAGDDGQRGVAKVQLCLLPPAAIDKTYAKPWNNEFLNGAISGYNKASAARDEF